MSTNRKQLTKQAVREWMAANPTKPNGDQMTYTYARRAFGLSRAEYAALPDGGKPKTKPADSKPAVRKSASQTGTRKNPFAGTVDKVSAYERAHAKANETGRSAFYRIPSGLVEVLPDPVDSPARKRSERKTA
jgi:hypothetical protein